MIGGVDDSQHPVVVMVEEVDLLVVAVGFVLGLAPGLLVLASDLSDVLDIQVVGEVVEELSDVRGGVVVELVGQETARPAHSRNSSTPCWRTLSMRTLSRWRKNLVE